MVLQPRLQESSRQGFLYPIDRLLLPRSFPLARLPPAQASTTSARPEEYSVTWSDLPSLEVMRAGATAPLGERGIVLPLDWVRKTGSSGWPLHPEKLAGRVESEDLLHDVLLVVVCGWQGDGTP